MYLKNNLQLIQNNYNNNFGETQMKLMNAFNMINELRSTINQLEQKMNMNFMNNSHINQFNQNLNNFPNINQLSFQKNSNNMMSDNNSLSVFFRPSGIYVPKEIKPIIINCKREDLISNIIAKYKGKVKEIFDINIDKKVKFIFEARELSPILTANETGLANNANIFVVFK